MWQTDTVTIQTKVDTNTYGSISTAWTDSANTIACDVQDISSEFAFKNYGITDKDDLKQVFDHTQSTLWVQGNQVKYNSKQYWVRLVKNTNGKIGASNHVYVILARVI